MKSLVGTLEELMKFLPKNPKILCNWAHCSKYCVTRMQCTVHLSVYYDNDSKSIHDK